MSSKVALIILDGWGIGKQDNSNAIYSAKTPFVSNLLNTKPNATLRTDGEQVGLPAGQMGNSEVGHLNIGAGRIVYQDLEKVNVAIKTGELAANATLINALADAKARQVKLHFIGLVSDGGVHSHHKHLSALCHIAKQNGVTNQYIHAFTDGRDTDPKSGKAFLETLNKNIEGTGAKVATVVGRYYAMDRDKRWERVKKAYDLLVNGVGKKFESVATIFEQSYAQNITDEFIEPAFIEPAGLIEAGDVVLCFNFRTDRCREITQVLTQEDMPEFGTKTLPLNYLTMTNYDKSFKQVGVIFDKDNLSMTLGETLAQHGKSQVRIAETEKYPHVTFFFSGGQELPFDGERRLLVQSPKVATYDLQPEMSAQGIADAICEDITVNAPDFICLNFANPDMVGHTGVFEAIVKAVETTDRCCQQVVQKALEHNYSVIVIADHGNADYAVNEDGSPNTAHTTNLVPVIILSDQVQKVNNGKLADVAPTVLKLMGIPQPKEMTGVALV